MKQPLLLAVLLAMSMIAAAQGERNLVDWRQARITDVGAYMTSIELKVTENQVAHRSDTIDVDHSRMVWQSQGVDVFHIENNDFYKKGTPLSEVTTKTSDARTDSLVASMSRHVRRQVDVEGPSYPQGQSGNLFSDIFNDFHYNVFTFEYPSIDANGKPVVLSAIAACPRGGVAHVNNVVLGTHVTITADRQRPSNQTKGFDTEDWGMLFSLAAGNKLSYKSYVEILKYIAFGLSDIAIPGISSYVTAKHIVEDIKNSNESSDYNNCLVIMPDYEGYGLTKNHAHPYLYQELTARQSVDALIYGKALYENAPQLEQIRCPLRSNYRTMSIGYSQGGSVSMASHRFIEQNGLAKDLHFSGSICGDGPYDPMATLMYYVKQVKDDKPMSMAVVLPLIMKGMLDTNPYMKNHQPSDYFVPKFIETGILDWIAGKEMSTDNIEDRLGYLYDFGKDGDNTYFRDILIKKGDKGVCRMDKVMTSGCYNYFLNLYNNYKDSYTSAAGIPHPTHRGVYEDLHLALASNDMTSGWTPEHKMILFHSKDDTVVPYVNYESATSRLGSGIISSLIISGMDHLDAGFAFFGQNGREDVVIQDVLRLFNFVDTVADWNY